MNRVHVRLPCEARLPLMVSVACVAYINLYIFARWQHQLHFMPYLVMMKNPGN